MKKLKSKVINPGKYNNQQTLLSLLGVIALTIIIYSNSFDNEFTIADDDTNIVMNDHIKNFSFSGFKHLFTTYYQGDYRPLTYLSYAFIHRIFGLNPSAFFKSNLLLHLLNLSLVFVFIQMIARRFEVSIIVCLLFAIHPMHVESVTWLSAHNDVLYAFFFLLSLITYIKYISRHKRNLLYLSVLLYIFSTLSKPMAIVLPAILLLIDHFTGRNFNRSLWLEKLPYIMVALIFMVITLWQRSPVQAAMHPEETYTFLDRVFLASYALIFYLIKLIWPFNLSAYYYFPLKVEGLLPFSYYGSMLMFILILFGVYRLRKYRREILFGLLFFLINLILVIQLIPFGTTIVADRYSYISYIGIFFIIGYFFSEVKYRNISFAKKLKPYMYGLLVFFIFAFSIATWNRNKVWKNSITLTSDVINKYPSRAMAYHHRGLAKNNLGKYEAAIPDFTMAVELNPELEDAYAYRGTAKYYLGDFNSSLKDYNKALELNPENSLIYHHRGLVKNVLENYSGAIQDFNLAIQINPEMANIYLDRGNAKYYLGQYEGAIEDFSMAISLRQDYADAYANRGIAYLKLNNLPQACSDFQKAGSLGQLQAQQNYTASCK